MKPRKIAFYGLFGQQNWGNECTLQAIIYNARRYLPDAELRCFCTGPHETLLRHNIPAFPISNRFAHGYPTTSGTPARRKHPLARFLRALFIRIPMELLDWMRAFKSLRGFDMLVVPGTGLLTDFASNPLGGPYYLLKWSLIAKLCRCKLLFVSVGAGPMYHPLTKRFIKWALSLAHYRSYRDIYSKEFVQSIGFKANNDALYPDLAFSLPRGLFSHYDNRNSEHPVIGVGVKDYYGVLGLPERGGDVKYGDFINKLATVVAWLHQNKYTVRLLIGDTLYDNSVKQDLMALLLARHGIANEDPQIINEPISSGEDVLSQLAATDIVVSARFHNVLLALMLNKPVVALSYHEKFAALVAGVGLPEYCHDIDCLDIERLTAQIVELEKKADDLTPRIRQQVEQYRNALEEQYARIF